MLAFAGKKFDSYIPVATERDCRRRHAGRPWVPLLRKKIVNPLSHDLVIARLHLTSGNMDGSLSRFVAAANRDARFSSCKVFSHFIACDI